MDFRTYELKWKRDKLYNEVCTKVIMEDIKRERRAMVVDIEEKENTLPPPLPLNTNKMLRISSANLGISPIEALKILESLYLNGYITYFLTESTNYGPNFNFEEILATHQLHSIWGRYTLNLLEEGFLRPTNGAFIDENLPLVPVKSAEKGKLAPQEWKIYQYIAKNFLASISKPAVYTSENVIFNIEGELFTLGSKNLIESNFCEIMPSLNTVKESESIGKFKKMQEYFIDTRRIFDAKTLPPKYLTEAELITQMEALKIGRNGKIAVHIQDLIENNYIQVDKKKGRSLIPTSIGIALVKGISSVDKELISPKIRAEIEKECSLISVGELDNKEVVNHILSSFKNKFDYFKRKFDRVEKAFSSEVIKSQPDKKDSKKESKGKKKDSVAFSEDGVGYEHCTVCYLSSF